MNNLSASTTRRTIIYLNLLSYIPPERVCEFPSPGEMFGEGWPQTVETAARLMVSFQSASRDPDGELVKGMVDAALNVDSSPEACRAFQEKMDTLAQLPGHAKAHNRLHRKRGCQLCESPCRYGYFSLISEPDFSTLQEQLVAESGGPVQAVWQFTLNHIDKIFQTGHWPITKKHLGNLSYCLISLATAKSRFAFPEEQMRKFQDLNQAMIYTHGGLTLHD